MKTIEFRSFKEFPKVKIPLNDKVPDIDTVEHLNSIYEKTNEDLCKSKLAEQTTEIVEDMYKKAFRVACDLMNGSIICGKDQDTIFKEILEKQGCVCFYDYEEYILQHLDEFIKDGLYDY